MSSPMAQRLRARQEHAQVETRQRDLEDDDEADEIQDLKGRGK